MDQLIAEAERLNKLSNRIIGHCLDIHRTLGPGLLESAYEEFVCHELTLNNISFERQKALPVVYKGLQLDCGYRLDIIVENGIILEIKAVTQILPIHRAQLLTYLKITGLKLGLLINFNVPVLKSGIRRIVNNFPESLLTPVELDDDPYINRLKRKQLE